MKSINKVDLARKARLTLNYFSINNKFLLGRRHNLIFSSSIRQQMILIFQQQVIFAISRYDFFTTSKLTKFVLHISKKINGNDIYNSEHPLNLS